MTTQTFTATLYVEECCSCHVRFGIDTSHRAALLRSHDWFYCPSGHKQYYAGKSDAETEREARVQAESRLKWVRESLKAEEEGHQRTRNKLRANKGALTKAKKRAAAGVCPCCSRTFQNVQRHVAGQHPTYVETLGVETVTSGRDCQ